MALINDVKRICDRLADAGWRDLMLKHGIDIKQGSAQKLAKALDAEVDVDASVPGFGDFIKERARGTRGGRSGRELAVPRSRLARSPSGAGRGDAARSVEPTHH